jgi:hypothetical protein
MLQGKYLQCFLNTTIITMFGNNGKAQCYRLEHSIVKKRTRICFVNAEMQLAFNSDFA